MLTIGLTGGIGVGKSAVAGILKGLGADIANADEIGHEVYRAGTRAYREIVRIFGERVAGADGEIDRKRLGSIVFGDRAKLEALNGIVWPGIRRVLQHRIHDTASRGATAALVVEAAVLFEAGWDDLFDEVWVVTAPEDQVLDRVQTQKGIGSEQARARIGAQMSPAEKASRAVVTIPNGCDLATLRRTVIRVWNDRVKEKI